MKGIKNPFGHERDDCRAVRFQSLAAVAAAPPPPPPPAAAASGTRFARSGCYGPLEMRRSSPTWLDLKR